VHVGHCHECHCRFCCCPSYDAATGRHFCRPPWPGSEGHAEESGLKMTSHHTEALQICLLMEITYLSSLTLTFGFAMLYYFLSINRTSFIESLEELKYRYLAITSLNRVLVVCLHVLLCLEFSFNSYLDKQHNLQQIGRKAGI
jgi:hypothetical protein